jgi:hypothetical protein
MYATVSQAMAGYIKQAILIRFICTITMLAWFPFTWAMTTCAMGRFNISLTQC